MDNSCPKCSANLSKRILRTKTLDKGLKGFLSTDVYFKCPECDAILEINKKSKQYIIFTLLFIPVFCLPIALHNLVAYIVVSGLLTSFGFFWLYSKYLKGFKAYKLAKESDL